MDKVLFYSLLLATPAAGTTDKSGEMSITKFISTLAYQVQLWGRWIVMLIGAVMVIAGIYQVAKGLLSQGRGQTNWAVTLLLIVIGGALMAGAGKGWDIVNTFSNSSNKTLTDVAGGTYDEEEAKRPSKLGSETILPGVITTYVIE